MRYTIINVTVLLISVILLCAGTSQAGVFEDVYRNTATNESDVREISYDTFIALRDSGERYVLVDVLPEDNYQKEHIAGAINMPYDTMTAASLKGALSPDENIVVYCGSFQCHASTNAAVVLQKNGYTVLDYKGGIQEWREKGNAVVGLQ